MKFFLLLVLFGLAAVSGSYLSNGQHLFNFHGSIRSTIAIPSGFSISRFRSIVILQVRQSSIILALKDIQILSNSFEKEVYNYKYTSIIDLTEEQNNLLSLPVLFTLDNGRVSNLRFDKNEELWSENFKRAVINMLQLQPKDHVEDIKNQHYRVREETIEGSCEVIYTRVMEGNKERVIKSVDFMRCFDLPTVNHHSSRVSQCGKINETKSTQQQSVYFYDMENGFLKNVEVESVYSLMHGQDTILTTSVKNHLTFMKSGSIDNEIEMHPKLSENLTYSMSFDSAVETFYRTGAYQKSQHPFKSYTTKVTEIREMLTSRHTSFEDIETINHLIRLLRMSTKDELDEIFNYGEEMKMQKQTFLLQSLATAGTKTTTEKLLVIIKQKKISHFEASMLFKMIQGTIYPSVEIAQLLLDFVQKNSGISSSVEQSAWLALGSIIRGIIVSKQSSQTSSASLKEKYNTLLFKQFRESRSTYGKILFLKTIGNAGMDISIDDLKKVILNNDEEVPVRLEAIDALRTLKDSMATKIHSILLPVYKNHLNQPEIRMSSLLQIVRSHPSHSILYQIVRHMEQETNEQMATFTHRVLTGYAESNIPCYQSTSSQLKSLLRMSSYRPTKKIRSSFNHFSMFSSDESLSGISLDLVNFYKKNSILPKEITASVDLLSSGGWNKNLIQLGLSQHNNELAVFELFRQTSEYESQPKKAYFTNRTVVPYSHFYIRYNDMDYAFIQFDLFDETEMINLLSSYRKAFQVNLNMRLNDEIIKIPTTSGLPLTVSRRLTIAVVGEKKKNIRSIQSLAKTPAIVHPSLSATNLAQMSIWSPFFQQGVKTSQQFYLQLGIQIERKFDEISDFIFGSLPVPRKHLLRMSSDQFIFHTRGFMNHKNNELPLIQSSLLNLPKMSKNVTLGNMHLYLDWRGSATTRDLLLMKQFFEIGYETSAQDFGIKLLINQIKTKVPESFSKKQELFTDDMKIATSALFLMKILSQLSSKDASPVPKFKFYYSNNHSPHIYNLSISYLHDSKNRVFAFNIIMTEVDKYSLKHTEPIIFNFTSLSVVPKYISDLKELTTQGKLSLESFNTLTLGPDKDEILSFGIRLMQSENQEKLRKEMSENVPVLQTYRHLKIASTLNQLELQFFKTPNHIKKMLNKAEDILKWITLFEYDEELVETKPKSDFYIRFTADPLNRDISNFTIENEHRMLSLRNYNIAKLPLLSLVNPGLKSIPALQAQCRIRGDKLETFDQSSLAVKLSSCYSVLSKDCSELNAYTILVRKMDEDSDYKMVKIIDREEIYTMGYSNEHVVLQKMTSDNSWITVEPPLEKFQKLGSYVRFTTSDFDILFNGRNISVYLNRALAPAQCGLCGLFDGESHNDLMTADYKVTEDEKEFFDSYRVDKDCQSEQKKKGLIQVQEMSETIKEELPTRTMIMEFPRRMCFSMIPVQDCPRHRRVLATESRKVRFTCIPHNEESRKMKSKAVQTPLDLSDHKVSYVDRLNLPVVCTHE